MIRDYFDKIITLNLKIKSVLFFSFILLLGLFLSMAKVTHPHLPLHEYRGILHDFDDVLNIIFLLVFIIAGIYFLYEYTPNSIRFRDVVRENLWSAFFIFICFLFLGLTITTYLATGKICLLSPSGYACLN